MCTAIALGIGQFVIGAASAVMGYQAQQAQYDAQMQAYNQNIKNANEALIHQYDQTQLKINQEREAAVHENMENSLEGARARGTAKAAAAQGGVSGLSVGALLSDYYAQQGRYQSGVQANFENTRDYLRESMKSQRAQAANQINSMPRPTKPSFAGAGIRIASAGLQGAGTYMRYS